MSSSREGEEIVDSGDGNSDGGLVCALNKHEEGKYII